jgi:hypothetical protein
MVSDLHIYTYIDIKHGLVYLNEIHSHKQTKFVSMCTRAQKVTHSRSIGPLLDPIGWDRACHRTSFVGKCHPVLIPSRFKRIRGAGPRGAQASLRRFHLNMSVALAKFGNYRTRIWWDVAWAEFQAWQTSLLQRAIVEGSSGEFTSVAPAEMLVFWQFPAKRNRPGTFDSCTVSRHDFSGGARSGPFSWHDGSWKHQTEECRPVRSATGPIRIGSVALANAEGLRCSVGCGNFLPRATRALRLCVAQLTPAPDFTLGMN